MSGKEPSQARFTMENYFLDRNNRTGYERSTERLFTYKLRPFVANYSQTGCSLASNIAILSHNIAILIGRLL
jgi:hypothetical protein